MLPVENRIASRHGIQGHIGQKPSDAVQELRLNTGVFGRDSIKISTSTPDCRRRALAFGCPGVYPF